MCVSDGQCARNTLTLPNKRRLSRSACMHGIGQTCVCVCVSAEALCSGLVLEAVLCKTKNFSLPSLRAEASTNELSKCRV